MNGVEGDTYLFTKNIFNQKKSQHQCVGCLEFIFIFIPIKTTTNNNYSETLFSNILRKSVSKSINKPAFTHSMIYISLRVCV